MTGWIVSVALPGGELTRLFAVAEPDQQRALVLVSDAVGITPPEYAEIAGPISAKTVSILGLSPGQVTNVTS